MAFLLLQNAAEFKGIKPNIKPYKVTKTLLVIPLTQIQFAVMATLAIVPLNTPVRK